MDPSRVAGNTGYTPFAQGNRSSGYDPINGLQYNRHQTETTNPTINFEDKWAKWFGQPPFGHYEQDNYALLGHENYQLPTAYIGRNLHIEKMLNVAIASEDDYYTRVLLPWKVYDGMKITYSKWSGFDHMMYQVPEEVPAPQIQTRFESGEAYQQRYGLAFKMEHGFQRTEMGQQAYIANLQIITQAVLRTVYTRIMQILVSQRNMLAVFAQKSHHNTMIQAREVSKLAVHSFGSLQKNTFGMDMVIGQIEHLFRSKMLAQPDAIILPQGCIQYLRTCKPEERVFALCGELSRRLELDPQRALTTNVYKNNYQIFEHKPMVVSDDSDQVNMLVREREVGNVFRLFRNQLEEFDNYASPTAIKIIDHDKQRWAMLTLGDVLRETGIWTGEFNDVTRLEPQQSRDHLTNTRGNPLFGCSIIGDLDEDQLHESTIRSAVRSIERFLNVQPNTTAGIKARLETLCKNNIWYNANSRFGTLDGDMTTANIGAQPETGTTAATASVEEVAEALQRAIMDSVNPDDPESLEPKTMTASIMGAVTDVVSATANMTDAQRGSIASAFIGAAPNFKASKSALKKVVRNNDASKAADLEAAYADSLRKEFKSNWKNINAEAKKIAALIGPDVDGRKIAGDQMSGYPNIDGKLSRQLSHVEDMGFSPRQRVMARWYLGCSIDLPTITALDAQGIVTPFGAYVFRPFQNFQMGSAIVMRAGTDTGFTAVGNSDFILGDNATNKTHLGHFTFYFEPVVTEGNHVMVARDIAFMGYNGGCGTEFFKSWKDAFTNSRDASHPRSLLAALAYQHESEEKYRCDPISMMGEFTDGSILKSLNTNPGANNLHYQTAGFYSDLMEGALADGTTRDASDDGFYNAEVSNYICYQGLQAERGPDKTFTQYTTNTGHLGDSETTDSSLAWSGMLSMKTHVDYHHAGNSVNIMSKST
jgi:hypothetical protein